MSTSAASHLSPSFPAKAAWGTATKLRAWQAEALAKYLENSPRDFLAVATPGAGKTTFALRIATELLARGEVERVIVVAPTEHLKTQWADAAARVGVQINPTYSNSGAALSKDYIGVAVTYAGVASRPTVYEQIVQRHRTLVIMDEVHHGGDALAWGDAMREAFTGATRRLCLTGTPFRSDTSPIPFVRYAPDSEGIRRSEADYTYGYADALRDGVVRPVLFLAYGGAMRWRTSAGDEIAAQLGEPATKDVIKHAWRTALDPKGEWIPSVLRAADKRLSEVRRHVPDAGGLVIASNQTKARAYAKVLTEMTGVSPTVVLSDDGTAGKKIEAFAASDDRWMVAVRMVSEGVDVPRLAVGVYATSTSTPLYFAQAVGRFVRARRRGETASVFLPTVPVLLSHAASMEAQRDHALDRPQKEGRDEIWQEDSLIEAANRTEKTVDFDAPKFEALESDAHLDHVLFDAEQFGMGGVVGSEDEADYLGLPGLLEPDQVSQLLRQRQTAQLKRSSKRASRDKAQQHDEPLAAHRALTAHRKELNSLVAAYARKTGKAHAQIHLDLRSTCGGPAVDEATAEQVQARINKIRNWFVGRR
ncbi:DEAD/DEAH box helicase [Dermatophilus congolensis]|uniref:DEAD/DEAH box helicase n=1 Tax=Dermatophilus congolensis TaxID=1863 RepID=UPI001AB0199A|nr:DEAD/DEAH box helicase [Dermatophilus congolensis]MBO3142515.1 DEAD/DEAH box helicase [Dermatophilus congolensis]MBO3151505.1 DEAD/DEAH box helicase [Dermatophilus congolensis]MBO3161493.1 DEAD/DEAH box helicase [Dermatophilus congolensis]MBO3162790.1 DEAD/DEAH box helicase [Dermatophilus congolensis]MBO3176344.1 DEAD/DEAH box helicase [Dermatophilus congolensis]